MRNIALLLLGCFALFSCDQGSGSTIASPSRVIQFVYTSDAHYGLTRNFRGKNNVSAQVVNQAMITRMNALQRLMFPEDGGVKAGDSIGAFDFVAMTGDVGNRSLTQDGIQSAAISWSQFATDYIAGITLHDSTGAVVPLYLAPGNHDINNAIGFYEMMTPSKDATILAEMYNRTMNPATPVTASTYEYATMRIHYSQNIGGIHFAFINIWPDSTELGWLAADLAAVSASMPVVIFAHDPPEVESSHFTNPNGNHGFTVTDGFENLLDMFASGTLSTDAALVEQRRFVAFLKAHTNIKAYFHGHDNGNEYYKYKGPDDDVALRTFRVDSPMKGSASELDASKLSFQVVSIDSTLKQMTVRECLWNSNSATTLSPLVWGTVYSMSLR